MLGPESETWHHVLDWRLLLESGRALLLQVAHPTVGAGVVQYSDFRKRPWQRLQRTVDSLMLISYGGDRTAAESARLRELHKDMKGIDHHGHRYHALNPEAYWWVHATLFEGAVHAHANFATPLSREQQERMYQEWREVGELLGLKPHHMPDDLAGFFGYFNGMVADRLEDNEAVRQVLAALADRRSQAPPGWPEIAWRVFGPVSADLVTAVTIGTLPEPFRNRLGLQWTRVDRVKLAAARRAVKIGMPLLPDKVRYHPMALAAKRAAAVKSQDVPGRSPSVR
ncbi:oxygenase MpaB family protein [Kibdelosporangium aridum]|uniref:oxygenase MpaB family protein n=1 Tax=Kibdelosporangium aridum TaxID=2030 RepID=UPI0005269AAD